VDITPAVCPLTFVKVKVALEQTEDKGVLYVKLNDGEPIQNIPRSLKDEGHRVIKIENNDDGTYGLYVVKNGLSASPEGS
jgi:TusA-related sulfurtransferase